MKVPEKHPRRKSLEQRKKIEDGLRAGIVATAGLIAQGRGEAFDYLLGEKTGAEAKRQIKVAAAMLLLAKKPVISVNGNAAALCAHEITELAKEIPAQIEINLFYRTEKRVRLIEKEFGKLEVKTLAGHPDKKIPALESKRGLVHGAGIYSADVVLVMIEDGDRTEFLRRMGKKVIAVDLNPLSRTAQKANVTIVDNITRCLPLLIGQARAMKGRSCAQLQKIAGEFENSESLEKMVKLAKSGLT